MHAPKIPVALFAAFVCALPAAMAQGWNQPSARSSAPAAPQIAPADIPYTNNVARDPGFEHGFEKDLRKGWVEQGTEGAEMKFISLAPNGAAKGPVAPSEGRKALKIAIKKPAKYSGKQLNGTWGEFLAVKPVAGGVSTLVPVKGGAEYAFKFDWCGLNFFQQETSPGPNRGLMAAGIYLTWLGKDMKGLPKDKVEERDLLILNSIAIDSKKVLAAGSDTWKTYAYPRIPPPEDLASGKAKRPGFLKAPEGAAFVKVRFGLASQHNKAKPELYIDNFVWAENPQVPAPPAKPAAAGK